MPQTTLITVCSECLQASCFQGNFMCDDAQSAGTLEKTVKELAALNLEHPDHWRVFNAETDTFDRPSLNDKQE